MKDEQASFAIFQKIADLFADIEITERRVERMVIGRVLFALLLDEPPFQEGSCLDATPDQKAESGYQGTFWNAGIYISSGVPDGHIVLLPEGDTSIITNGWVPLETQLSALPIVSGQPTEL